MQAFWATAFLLISTVAGQAPGPAEGMSATRRAHSDCWELCKHAKGLGASSCMTECRSYTDTAPHPDEALKEFVADESYNEAGGEDMEEAYEEKHGEEVPSCHPQFAGKPSFDDIDLDHDGILTASEVIDFGEKMCVSDEMAMQLFSMADRDRNKVIDPKEWKSVGEDTKAEQAIDDVVDKKIDESKKMTDDEYNEVNMPAFEEFDKDRDGELNDEETQSMIMFEFHRRFPDATEKELNSMAGEMVEDLAGAVAAMDHDGDGFISKAEYERPADKADLGGELQEATEDDKDEKEPDDLKRVEHPTAAPPPEDFFPAGPAPGAASPAPAALFFARLHGVRGSHAGARGLRLRRGHAGRARAPPQIIRSLAARALRRKRSPFREQHFRIALTRLARRVAERD